MRIGLTTTLSLERLDWLRDLGLRSVAWMRFPDSPAGLAHRDWKPWVDEMLEAAQARDIRISAIGAWYRNALDPRQTETATAVLRRAIEVAAHARIPTVSAFAGGVIETDINERGGNPVYRPIERGLPQWVAFWKPMAQFAAAHGVRIAFENCAQGTVFLPILGYNAFARPALWDAFLDAAGEPNLGLEWDPSHLICQLIDPVENLRRFGQRVFHVHAKDAHVDRHLLEQYGICHPGVSEHRVPGLGQANWGEIVRRLIEVGYDSDLNIEGWHDPVYRDHDARASGPMAGRALEETGIRIALATLRRFLPQP